MADKVLFLCSCKDAMEAEIVKGALKDMGIECILQGENISRIYGGISAMSVNILVDEKDYNQARAFIDSREAEHYDPEMKPEPESVKKILLHTLAGSLVMSAIMTAFNCARHGFNLIDATEYFISFSVALFTTFASLTLLKRKFFKQ